MSVICPYCEREIDIPEIVELDGDQTPHLPAVAYFPMALEIWQLAQQDMIDRGWRKVH